MNVSLRKLITIDISNYHNKEAMRCEWHKNGIWVTKEGTKIPVAQMSDSHLINIFFMLEKKAESLSTTIWAYPEPQGEMAQDAYYNECLIEDEMGGPSSKEEVLAKFPIYPFIVEELKRRGL